MQPPQVPRLAATRTIAAGRGAGRGYHAQRPAVLGAVRSGARWRSGAGGAAAWATSGSRGTCCTTAIGVSRRPARGTGAARPGRRTTIMPTMKDSMSLWRFLALFCLVVVPMAFFAANLRGVASYGARVSSLLVPQEHGHLAHGSTSDHPEAVPETKSHLYNVSGSTDRTVGLVRLTSPPFSATLSLTNACTHQCVHICRHPRQLR